MSDWQEVTDTIDTDTWDREGTVQGVYKSRKENVGPNDSRIYIVESGNKSISIWGSAVLDSRFDQIPVGSEVRIESLGKTTSEKTGRSYYDYKVEFRPAPFVEAGEKPKSSAPIDDGPPVESRTEEPPF